MTCDCRAAMAALEARIARLEADVAAAVGQAKAAIRTADLTANGAKGRPMTKTTLAVRTLALAKVRPAVIAAALGITASDVSQRICLARKQGVAIPPFPAVKLAPTRQEVAEARRLAGLNAPDFDLRAAMARMLRSGARDNLFIGLCKAHPAGPPADVVPPREDGAPWRGVSRDIAFSVPSSHAALCAEV